MTEALWQKAGQVAVDEQVQAFLAGDDVMLDRLLLPFDVRASQAHARGLARIQLISEADARALVDCLDDLAAAFSAGEFTLDQRFEDGHSAIEWWLVERLGELGRRVHAGRSRNDQVAVALRLYLKDRLGQLARVCAAIADIALQRADQEGQTPLPGHTHLQQAMPSSLGLWWAGHAEAFVDNLQLVLAITDWLDASPLGTASGFGVNLPLDRDGVADELGFARLVINPQNAQNSRGKVELRALDALAACTGDVRRLSWDLSLFASQEFGYVQIPSGFCTGSSIMPNKHNPDSVELLRALHGTVVGARMELESVMSLPSGYQRDLQDTKPPLLRAMERGLMGLNLVPPLLAGLVWQPERMAAAITPAMHATDRANELVAEGMPFRDAYRQVAAELNGLASRDAADSLAARTSPGGCGALRLDHISERLQTLSQRTALFNIP